MWKRLLRKIWLHAKHFYEDFGVFRDRGLRDFHKVVGELPVFRRHRPTVEQLEDRITPGGANVHFTSGAVAVPENASYATITAIRTGAPTATVTVDYASSDGSAYAGTDYSSTSGTLTFGFGVTTQSFTVPLLGHVETSDVAFTLTLSNPVGIPLGTPSTEVVTLQQPPTASNASASVQQGQTTSLDLASYGFDPSSLPMTASIVTSPSHGSVVFNTSTGHYDYTADSSYVGSDSFQFTVNDGIFDSNTATVSIGVTGGAGGTNHAPVASDIGPVSVLHGQTTTIDLAANTSDADGDTLSISIVQNPTHGYLSFNSSTNKYYYTASNYYTGSDSFTYKANDGALDSNIATVAINVTDQAPVAGAIPLVSVLHGQTAIIDLAANVSDADNDALGISIVQYPTQGYFYFNSSTNKFYYIASTYYTGSDSFTYKANDGALDSNTITVSINVTDHAPTASDIGPVSIQHGQTTTIDLAANTSDADGDALNVSIVQNPSHGYLYLNSSTNKYSYVASGYYTGTDSFTYKVNDGALDSNTATVSINVTDVAPVAADIGPVLVLHGQTATIDLTASTSDADGDALNISIVQYPSHGYLYLNSSTKEYSYVAANYYTGSDSFTYKANDGALDSNVATVSLTVTDQAPTASDIGIVSVLHGQTTTIDLAANTSDADGDALNVSIVQYPSHGYLYLNSSTNKYSYVAANYYAGSDSFTYKANDGALDSNTATVSINVTDQAPMASDVGPVSVLHNQTTIIDLAANTFDADNDTLGISIVQYPAHGYLYFNSYTNKYSYTASNYYAGSDSFTYKANDGALDSNTAMVSINVTDVAPVASAVGIVSVLHGQSTNIDLNANVSDADGDTLSTSIVQSPSHGSVSWNWYTGKYIYSADSNYTGSDSFTYKANDGALDSNTATVSINVTDQAPEANVLGSISVLRGQTATIDLAANTTDADGDTLDIGIVQNPSHGYLSFDYYTNRYSYSAYSNYTGSDSFTYKANDGALDSNTATVSIDVTDLTVAWISPADITYGIALNSTQLDATAPIAGTFVYTPAAGAILGAGTHILSVTFTPTDTTYPAVTQSTVIDVTQAALTVSGITASNKVYNATTSATLQGLSSATLNGIVGSDVVSLDIAGVIGSFASKDAGTGVTVQIAGLTLTGADAANYTLTQPTTTANIATAALTITGVGGTNKTYDGTTSDPIAGAATLNGILTGDIVNLATNSATASFASKYVGIAKPVTFAGFTLTGADAGNYTVVQPVGSANITAAPLIVTALPINAAPATNFTINVATFIDPNGTETAASYVALVDWGNGMSSSGTVTANTDGTFTIAATNNYADTGSYPVTVWVVDAAGDSATGATTATIQAPFVFSVNANNLQPDQNGNVSGLAASLTSTDPNAVPNNFTASINWGDQLTSSGAIVVDSFGNLGVQASHRYTQTGIYTFTVTITDSHGDSSSATGISKVDLGPLQITTNPVAAAVNIAFDGTLATFTDVAPWNVASDFTPAITWGDGQSSDGSIVDNGDGTFSVQGSHTYTATGSFSITTTVTDPVSQTVSATTTATVAALSLDAASSALTLAVNQSFSGTVLSFTSDTSLADLSAFTGSINWGDGNTSSATLVAQENGFTVQGNHVYTTAGAYTITISVADGSGDSFTGQNTANVQAGNLAVSGPTYPGMAAVNQPYDGILADFVDVNNLDDPTVESAVINWGTAKLPRGRFGRWRRLFQHRR